MARTFVRASSQYARNTTAAPISGYPATLHCLYKPASLPSSNFEEHVLVNIAKATGLDDLSIELYRHGEAPQDRVRALGYSNGAAQVRDRYLAQTLTTGQWYAITGVFTNSTTYEIYVDAVAGSDYNTTGTVTPSGFTDLQVGAIIYNTSSISHYANGDIAEVAVWDAALTVAEIEALSKRVSPLQIRPSNLVSYAPLYGKDSPEPEIVGGLALTLTNTPAGAVHPNVFRPSRSLIATKATAGGGTTGTWASQLANITDSWSGLAITSGTWNSQLASVTGSWDGSVAAAPTGTWSSQLADATGSWNGISLVTGTWSSQLADVTGSWTGVANATGTWSSNLANVTGSWDGVVGDVVAGSWSSQLANITDAWSGTVSGSVGSWSSQLDPVTGSWDGIALVTGTWSSQLANVTGSWDGSLAINVDGSWNSQLAAITGSWNGAVAENATGTWNSQLAAITGAWDGSVTGSAVYPSANQVLLGIQYGPTGADFTGTLVSPTVAEIVAGLEAAVVAVNVKKINSVTVIGVGTSGDLWRA